MSPEYNTLVVRHLRQFWRTSQSMELFFQDVLQICGQLDDYNIKHAGFKQDCYYF